MRIGRTIPPAAAPLKWSNLAYGVLGVFRGEKERKQLIEELKVYYNKRHCFLVSSGKVALTLILEALKEYYPGRTKVLIPAYTCYSVPSAITRAGLEVVLCDISETSFDFDFRQIEPLLKDEKLLCVIPTHLYGIPADIERLRRISCTLNIPIVEDAAQAMGGVWCGKKLGTLGDASFFSIGRGKSFSTIEGGIILTDRDDFAVAIKKRCRQLPSYSLNEILILIVYAIALKILMHPDLFWIPKSIPALKLGETIYDPNFKMRKLSYFQAGLAKGWLQQLNSFKLKRRQNATFWMHSKVIGHHNKFISDNDDLPDMIRFPIKVQSEAMKDRILIIAERFGLGISPGYPNSINRIQQLAAKFEGQNFPQAKQVAERLVTLPLHPFLSNHDLANINHKIKFE